MDCNDLFQFAKEEPSDPFLHTLSPFPVHRTALQPPTFDQAGNERPSYIPAHLPAFPAAHTYDSRLHRAQLHAIAAECTSDWNARMSLITTRGRYQSTVVWSLSICPGCNSRPSSHRSPTRRLWQMRRLGRQARRCNHSRPSYGYNKRCRLPLELWGPIHSWLCSLRRRQRSRGKHNRM